MMNIVMCNNDDLMQNLHDAEMTLGDERFFQNADFLLNLEPPPEALYPDKHSLDLPKDKGKDVADVMIHYTPQNQLTVGAGTESFQNADLDLEFADYFGEIKPSTEENLRHTLLFEDPKKRKGPAVFRRAQHVIQERVKSLKHRHVSAGQEDFRMPLSRSYSEDWASCASPKQRRVKWSDDDITNLWVGIQQNGNNWREVKKHLPKRSYHQVKDKGRRLLQQEYWRTGRSKNDADGACECAKSIAEKVLKR